MSGPSNRTTTTFSNRARAALLAVAGLALAGGVATLSGGAARMQPADAHAELPTTLSINAMIRDFKAKAETNGHNDFQNTISSQIGLVRDQLSSTGKPQFQARRARTITTQSTDSGGRNIMPSLFDAARGDRQGATTSATIDVLTDEARFNQWYTDVPGTNMSKTIPLTLTRVSGTNRYVFDSATDPNCVARGGFFPINGDLFGNYSNTGKNFHFTTEIRTNFNYARGQGQVFTFTGDDDVWVFIGGRLAIDLGGVHGRIAQTVDLDRLSWLQDGQQYELAIFHAERHTTQSNFRMETTLRLRPAELPQDSSLAD